MALFGRKKKGESLKAAPAQKKVATPSVVAHESVSNPGATLLRPRLTEKGAVLSERGVYAFEVHPKATKADIAKAVQAAFKVTPVAVRIVRIPAKKVLTRQTGKEGRRAGGKKAYVELKAGDKIELV